MTAAKSSNTDPGFETVKSVNFLIFLLFCLQLGKKSLARNQPLIVVSPVKCIFSLEMRILESVAVFEPICFEKNVHFLARDNELYTWQRSSICQNLKTHGKTPDHVTIRNDPECRSIVGFQQRKTLHVRRVIQCSTQFRIVASLTRFPNTETDSWHKNYSQTSSVSAAQLTRARGYKFKKILFELITYSRL